MKTAAPMSLEAEQAASVLPTDARKDAADQALKNLKNPKKTVRRKATGLKSRKTLPRDAHSWKDSPYGGARHLRPDPRVSLAARSAAARREKILQGALAAVARQGTKKLSMGDICQASGVSRGTLYRYFATKEDVLQAMSEFVSISFESGVVEAARQYSEPLDVLKAVLDFHFSQASRISAHVLEIEPTFVVKFLRGHFARHVAAMKVALAPVFSYVEREGGLTVNRDLFVQALIRIELSTLLVPGDPIWNRFPDLLPNLLRSFCEPARPLKQSKG